MKDYFNRRKSNVAIKREQSEPVRFAERKQLSRSGKLLLFTLLAVMVGASPAGAQKALPYSYGFEDYDLATDGWTTYFGTSLTDNNSECAIVGAAKKTGSYGFRFSSYKNNGENEQYLISPELSTPTGVDVTFAYAASNSNGTEVFKVGYSTTDAGISSFTWGDEISYKSTSWTTYSNTFPAGTKYIAIYYYSNWQYRLYVDDFTFATPPTCIKPTGLTTTDLTISSVTLGWTSDGNAWNVQYKKAADAEWTDVSGTVTTNSYTLTGLTPATAYEARVRTYCDASDQSEWTDAVSFTTDCATITAFPFTENFNSLTSGSIPMCWDNSEGTTTTDSYKWSYIETAHDGHGVRFNSYNNGNGNTNMLKTPAMNLPKGKTMQLSFWYKNPAGGDFSVYVSGDGGATYATALATGLTGQSEWKQMEMVIPAEFTDNVVIVFQGTSNYGYNDAYIYLDDVTVEEAPSVLKPTALTASNPTWQGATLSWTAGSDETAWKVIYGATDFDPETQGTTIDVTENPYTLTGLTPETAYDVYVKAVKDTDVSQASDKASFTTTERYPAPAGLTISNLTTTSATLTWTAGEATAWEVAVNTTGETPTEAGTVVNAATYEFTKLTAETTYYAFVRTKDGDNYSAWSAACEFLPSANTYLTVNDGTTTNSYVPVYGYFSESTNLGGQFIIPAASLTDVQNKVIKKLTFYSATSEYAYGDAEFDVCLKEVSDTYFPSSSMYAWDAEDWTKVYSGTIAIVGGKMNITFTSDFNYAGSNLLVGIHKTSTDKTGSNWNVTFYGNNASSNMSNYSPNGSRQKFQPKTTIGYQEKTGSELKVFDGETELAVSPASFDFGLAEAGTTHTFTLKNTAATPYVATISSENLTVNPTSVIPTAEGATFTVAMPEQDITDEAVVITPAAESGLEPFTINVSGTVKDPNKLFEDFSGNAKPEDWTATGNSFNWSFTSGYASYGGYSDSYAGNLTTPKLVFTAGEKFFFDAKMSSTSDAAGMTIQTSTDGNSFSDLMTITNVEISSSAWNSFSVEIPSADVKYIRFANCIYMAIDNVYGGSIPVEPRMVVTQPTSLDFGAITENTAKTFTIANTGKATLNGITVTSSNSDVFTISGAPTFLEAGASQDVTITMAATTTGVLSSEITVSATDMEDVKFTVTGVVVPAGLPKEEFTEGLPENWTNSGWSIANGIASAKSTSTMTTPKLVFAEGSLLTIKIKNYDTDATNKITIKGSTDNGSTWTYTKEIPSSNFISNSDWTTLIISDIPSNVNKLQFVGFYCHVDEIAGLYYAPELAVKQGEETVTSPVAYNFGENLTADATVTYTLSNAGAGTLNITNVAITGEGATAYSTNWTESVAAPFDLTITRTYDGTRTGVQEAVVTVTTDDGDFVVNVTGSDRGYDAPEMSIDATPIDFGKVSANNSKTITVTNIGTGSMTVNITSDNALFTINPAQLTEIGANQSKDFTVTFNYNNVEGNYGEKTAKITVTPTYDETANVIIAATAKAKNPNVWSEEFADANIEERGWTKGGWSITDGKAVGNSGAGYLYTPYLEVADASEELTVDYEITSSFGAAITYQVSTDRGATWSAAKYYPADYGKTYESPLPNGDKGTFTISVDAAGVYQFRFQAMGYNLDNFEGFKRYVPEYDAEITDTNIPTNGYVGRSYTATVTVAEKLGKEGENATATLYFGDEAMASETKNLTAGGNTEFTLTFTPEDAQSATAKIVVSYAGGELNGTSKSVTIHEVITFDEANGNAVESGQLVPVLLKRSFIQGWNTICVPFAILNPKSVFGDDVKIYQFTSYSAEQGLGFTAINLSNGMDAGVPYLAYIPSAVSSELFFESVSISPTTHDAVFGGVTFTGCFDPILAGNLTGSYVLTPKAKIAKAGSGASLMGFRAYFTTTGEARMSIRFDDGTTTAIGALTTDGELELGTMYNLQGQKVQGAQKGLYIINGKKVVRK